MKIPIFFLPPTSNMKHLMSNKDQVIITAMTTNHSHTTKVHNTFYDQNGLDHFLSTANSCNLCTQKPTFFFQIHLVSWLYVHHLQTSVHKSSQLTSCRGIDFYHPCMVHPKSFYKALFISTYLGAALRKMSHSKMVNHGLKPQEYEKNWD